MELLEMLVSYLHFIAITVFISIIIFFFIAGKRIGKDEEIEQNKKSLIKDRML